MTRTIACLYDTFPAAMAAADRVAALGVREDDIGVLSIAVHSGRPAQLTGLSAAMATDVVIGAEAGLALGGAAGLATGLGLVAIPGIGPIVAAGWLAATALGALTGIAAGTLVGGLVGHGHPEDEAHLLAEGVRRGCTMVTAKVPLSRCGQARSAMASAGPVDLRSRRDEWHADGWRGFDPDARAYTPAEVVAERSRHLAHRAA